MQSVLMSKVCPSLWKLRPNEVRQSQVQACLHHARRAFNTNRSTFKQSLSNMFPLDLFKYLFYLFIYFTEDRALATSKQ